MNDRAREALARVLATIRILFISITHGICFIFSTIYSVSVSISRYVSRHRAKAAVTGAILLFAISCLVFDELTLSMCLLVPYIAGVFLLAKWPDPMWLAAKIPLSEVKRLGSSALNPVYLSQLNTLDEAVHNIPDLERLTSARLRAKDTEDICTEVRAAVFKALFIYLFVTSAFVLMWYAERKSSSAKNQIEANVTHSVNKAENSFSSYSDIKAIAYLGILLAYVCWHGSECYLHYRRNHLMFN